jgi:sulfide:quinone oxidoreductase
VKKAAPVVGNDLMQVIVGREPDGRFDGCTSCPLIVREGWAMLIEFGYDGVRIIDLGPRAAAAAAAW